MNIPENIHTASSEESIVLGVASTETQGTPIGTDEPLGRDLVLGIASEDTRGAPVGTDEPLGMDFPDRISDR